MAKLKCKCAHRGNCLFKGEPLKLTYPDGSLIFRELTEEEREALPDELDPEEDVNLADYVATNGEGDIYIEARAIDPERAAEYGQTFIGRSCKADSKWWRMRNPIPAQEF